MKNKTPHLDQKSKTVTFTHLLMSSLMNRFRERLKNPALWLAQNMNWPIFDHTQP